MKRIKWLVVLSIMFTVLLGGRFGFSASAASSKFQVEINKSTNKLYLYKDGQVAKTYPVATGRTKDLTPEGTFPMVVKIVQPGWKGIPGGDPKNPLGKRWIGFSVKGDNGRVYGIHGTNQPSSIGKYVSNGCIRMNEANLLELYSLIPEGTPVWIHSGKSTAKWKGESSVTVQSANGKLKIKGNKVNVRTGPSTGAFVVTQLNNGTVVDMIGKSGDWYQVRMSSGKTGFIRKDFVTQVSGSTSTTSSNSNGFSKASGSIVATENVINVRSEASMTAQVRQKVSKGTKMTLIGENKEWYQIQTKAGYVAYVHKTVAKKS
ncbi:SH3 domain-containing protein [Thermoactinomyces sp. DSM 45891]|uniref:L,D-transpeptidase family protein n=1 Tax=Thermoactinomyces sp. DSM 45891 TaxID=1761907 RepID=UPI0009169325|nr:L,D-transpeptidase family protein [Thermoactinomyces sp. DSM 45891]SFX75390.1 SH3 domain-containing protein [Thermoactinomyces sp. DSM 45891]